MTVAQKMLIRKRITRTGSGAYSIYLPKKWVDSWSEEQRRNNEVHILHLGNHIVITPVHHDLEKEVMIHGEESSDQVKQLILSAYVRGYSQLRISSDRFTDEQIGNARSYMRILDEKLVPTANDHIIGYESHMVPEPLSFDDNELLFMLFAKAEENLELTSELLSYFDLNPSRAVHTLKTIYAIEREDIDRLTYQIYRRMANLEFPTTNFSDLYYLILIVSYLERIGDTLFSIAGFICNMYGFKRHKLTYPLELLKEEVEAKKFKMPKSFYSLKTLYSNTLREALRLLREGRQVIVAKNGRAAYDYKYQVRESRFKFEDRNFEMTDPLKFDIQDTNTRMILLYTIRIGYRIRELLRYIESLGKRACLFYYVEGNSKIPKSKNS